MDGLGEILHILNHLSMRRYNEQHDGIETSKIFSENGSVESETRQITNVDVEPWLNQRKPVGEGDDDSGDILRIVWVCRDGINTHSCRYEIKKSNEDRILEQFDVKTIHRLVTDGAFICLPANSAHQSSKQYFALAISGHIAVLVWAHNSTTNTTEAIWWGNNSYMPITVVQKVLEHQKKLARHPMFMALVVAICLSQSIQDLAESIRGTVNRVESRTQHCHLTLRSRAIAQGSYASLSAMMSASATRLGSIGGLIGTLSDILDSISAYHRPQGAQEPEWTETVVTEVNEYVSILRKRQQGQERRISYLTRRAEIQLNTVSFSTPPIFLCFFIFILMRSEISAKEIEDKMFQSLIFVIATPISSSST